MPSATRWSLIKDIIGGVAFIILGGVFLRELGGDVPPAAAKYPAALIYMIFALCLVLLARSGAALFSGKNPAAAPATEEQAAMAEEPTKIGFATVFVLVLSLAYILAMPYIGFIVASAAMLVIFMLVMGVRSIPVLVLVPLAEIAFLWYVFEKLLAVFLPDAYWLKSFLGMI